MKAFLAGSSFEGVGWVENDPMFCVSEGFFGSPAPLGDEVAVLCFGVSPKSNFGVGLECSGSVEDIWASVLALVI